MQIVTNSQNYKFFTEALKTIVEARRAVAWTYPYGYFLEDQAKKNFYQGL